MVKIYGEFFIILIGILSASASATPVNESNTTLMSTTYWCDDQLQKDFVHQLQLLNAATENIRLQLEAYNLRLGTAFVNEKAALLQEVKQLFVDYRNLGTGSGIDIRYGGIQFPTPDHEQKKREPTMPTNCAEALRAKNASGIYQLHLPSSGLKPFYVYCLADLHGGPAWTILQRRQDGSEDFYRDWIEYKRGFGNLHNEYFIGLDKIHALTNDKLNELWIQMEDFEGVTRFAKYDSFAIGDEDAKYPLNVLGKFSGDAGDSLTGQSGRKFTTKDMDNDTWNKNCAVEFTGAWWYAACHSSNLNGQYLRGEYPKDKFAKGINWKSWHGHYYSLKYVHMAIRPVK